jgi:phage terminase small subunit
VGGDGVDIEKMKKNELIKYAAENDIAGIDKKMTKDEILKIFEKENIYKDLLDQLDRNGVYGKHYIDLVNDYMALWEVKNKLIQDIREKGVSVKYQNGENQWGYKKNDSVRELTTVNNQMLRLLDSLGLKASKLDTEEEYDDLEM